MSEPTCYIIGSAFWEAFWPNFAATGLGVVLGIPIALWLDRRGQRKAERDRQGDRARRLRDIARLLAESLRANAANLRDLANKSADTVTALSELEVASWMAVREEALDLIPSIKLKRDLARHFEAVARIAAMDQQRTQRIASRLNEIRMGEDQVAPLEEQWQRILKERASQTSSEASRLVEELNELERHTVDT